MALKILHHHLKLCIRNLWFLISIIGFFVISLGLYGYSSATDSAPGQTIAALITISFMFALLLGMPKLFQEDQEDGSLDQWTLWPCALELIVAMRLLAHGLAHLGPVLAAVPLVAILLQMPMEEGMALMGALGLGACSMLALAALAEAATLGRARQNIALMVMIMPCYLPILLFILRASGTTDSQSNVAWLLLTGLALALISISILGCAALIRRRG